MPTNPKPCHLECGIVHLDVPYKRFTSRSGILRIKMSWASYIVLLCVVLMASSGKTKKRRDSSPDRRNTIITNTLKQDILSLMRMVRRPRPSMMARLNGRRLSAPVYMVKLYKSISQNQSYYDGFCCNGTIADWRAVGADTIMSYFNQVRKRPPKISRHHATFKFQVQSPTDEKVMAAEFRLYKERVSSPDKQSWKNATYMVRLYQVIYPAHVLDLLGTRVLRDWEAGWQAFDITKAGKAWSKKPSTNYGLELSVVNWLNQEVNPHRVGFVGFHGPLDKRPFLVSFFQHEGAYSPDSVSAENQTNQTSRSSRSLDSSSDEDGRTTSGAGSKKSGDAGPSRGGQGGRGSRTGSNHGGSTRAGVGNSQRGRQNAWSKFCQRRFLHVTFRRLGWHSWIIAPEGYSAFFCHGECSFPLNANMNVTNHAIVQTVVHLMHPRSVPKPCCAPTKLSPISVLFYDDKNNVVLKKYSNMVVKECGCQ